MAKKPYIEPDKCISCGTCVALAPNTFKMEDGGKAIAIHPAGDDESTIQMAIDSCPTRAINWIEE